MYKNKSIIVIIPARGGSKGISRKNIRFLNQNPLIAYIIKTSKSSKYVDKTIVTTDDEEISNISNIYGVDEIIKRPIGLADDKTTLDPVIYHAYKTYQKQENEKFDIVVTLQPTSPLLTSESLDKAIEKLVDQDYSTIISGIPVRHLFWEKKEKQLQPYHPKRLNRQELEPVFFETGSFVISKTDIITENSRISEPMDIFELDATEAIDIDTYLDWVIADKILSRKKFLIRVDGNNEIGMGHIYNTLILADKLVSHDIIFVMNKNSQLGIQKIAQNNYPIIEIENEKEFFMITEKENPDIVILDILDTGEDFINNILKNNLFVVSFEDLGAALDKADLVFNAIYEFDESSVLKNVFSGYPYVCLRDEFFTLPFKTIDENVKNILITFGGIDQNYLTNLCLDVFEELNRLEIEITII
ncbi:MAG: UDP-2,4-diacetamido-2,4,6-trideoxy-beta-L-altropyranose hydrolase, partial [Candidatus Heimdallarchaeota archaeon]|nr:UDP-2,4-diacetamido-2,4,6-trideoxy-beta-L-altropyranose hydrolase [Candidatus Heimdallarchaeota archaeon]